ncbi:MAG: CDP-glycerol glycerophosphotransferase family protein [Mogibacterium sp.]|nr:CDP-glycerol glycerophosphotransferase family protein [Mogibacterium sp.]
MNSKKTGKVVIISRESDEPTVDIAMLDEELRSRGIETEVMTKLFTKDKSAGDLAGYLGTVAKQEAAILKSDVVVLDTYNIPVSMLPRIGRTKVIQMWHALSAVKKFGWQTVGSEDGASERTATLMRMHKGYDYVLAPSDVTADIFAEAFRTERSKIIKLGLPRIDYINSAVRGNARFKTFGAMYALYPELAKSNEKKIVLYAPTFRRDEMPDIKGLATALDPQKYVLIVSLHPLYRTEEELPQADNIIYEENISSFDLLGVADIIISDYSSMVVESTLADKPLYLYTYDIDQYRETTGLNMDFASEAIGKYVFRDAALLAMALGEPYDMEALRAFRNKYIEVDTDNCTGQLADFIESLLPEKKVSDEVTDPEPEQTVTEDESSEPVIPTGLKED